MLTYDIVAEIATFLGPSDVVTCQGGDREVRTSPLAGSRVVRALAG